MASYLDNTGLARLVEKLKLHITSQFTKDNIINALGYTPTSVTELVDMKFKIENGRLIMEYPDDIETIPTLNINADGHLIYTY